MQTKLVPVMCMALICVGTVGFGERPNAASTALLSQVTERYAYEKKPGPEMMEAFSELAQRGDPRASLWVARFHCTGRCGLAVDEALAQQMAKSVIEKVRVFAEAGDSESQFLMAACYHQGLGIDQDLEEAGKWYERAVQQKNINAYNNYAVLLTRNIGVKQDIEKARRLYAEGAAMGDHRSAVGVFDSKKPDATSLRRRVMMRGNKLFWALGKSKDEALAFLIESKIISRPEAYYDATEGSNLVLNYEDDGVVLYVTLEGFVRALDLYPGMTDSDRIRGGIPLGIDWNDTKAKIINKLGSPDDTKYYSPTGMFTQSYRAGNLRFSLHSLASKDMPVVFWRIRLVWPEVEPSVDGKVDSK